jgi:hypothetical protein
VTCHGFCKEYKEWQKYNKDVKEWLKSYKPAPPEGAKKALTNKIKQKARGWNGKRGSTKDYGG